MHFILFKKNPISSVDAAPSIQREANQHIKEFLQDNRGAKEVLFKAKNRKEAENLGFLNVKKYKTGNYKFKYFFFPGHVNYVDEAAGDVVAIDPTFERQADNTFVMSRASYTVKAPEYADEAMSFIVDGETTTFIASNITLGTLTTPVLHIAGVQDDNKVIYTNAFGPGVDYVLQAEPDELRKLVVFKAEPADISRDIRIEFTTSLKNKALLRGRNTKIENVFFRQPAVWDSSGIVEPIDIKLNKEIFTKIIPKTFFDRREDQPQLVYPVTTDVTTSYYAGAGDGYVYYSTAIQSWATAHAETGDNNVTVDYTGTTAIGGSQNDSGGAIMRRAFFPVSTSGIADNDEITAARLKIYATATSDGDNDGNDYLVVVQTTQASTSSLTGEDYDQCGSVTDPTAGSATLDITSVTTSAYNTLTLNSTGEEWISKTGTTQLGIREGHDAVDDPVTASATNGVTFSTSENTGTTQDPVLEVDTTAAAISSVTTQRTIFATSTANVIVSSSLTGETAASSTLEYVLFLDKDGDNAPDTDETYVTGDCAGSALWSANMYTYVKSGFTIANGESPKTHSWECANTSFPENGLYTIYLKWKDANGTIATLGTTDFQSCDQPTSTNNWYDTTYENRVIVNFRSATFSEALLEFPALVKATTTNFGFDDPDSSSQDVIFIDGLDDGETALSFEREFYDATTTREGYWWVRVPKIATSTDCDYVQMYYDKANATDTSSSTATWRQDYYEAVWHFGEYATTTATTYTFQDGVSPTAGYAGTEDVNIKQNGATTNYNADTNLCVDYNGDGCQTPTTGIHRTLMQWDISTILSCTVSSASITVNNNITNGDSATIRYGVQALRRNWTETGVTWNTYDGTNSWTTAGAGDTTNDRYATDLMNGNSDGGWGRGTPLGSITFDFDSDGVSAIQDWINGTVTNNGIIVADNSSSDTNAFIWRQRGYATTSSRPKLTIVCGDPDPIYLDSTLNNHDETNSTIASRKEKEQSKFGYSPKFDGSTSVLGIPDSAGFDVTSYTITGWYRRDGTGDPVLFSALQQHEPLIAKGYAEADTQAADIQFSVGYNRTGQATLAANWEDDRHASGNDWSHLGGTTISNSVWKHFGVRLKDKAILNLYLDGFKNNTTTYSINQGASTGGTMKLGIGTAYNTAGTSDGKWNGYLDEIRVYKVALATTTASDESAWLRAEWYTADNGYVEWGAEATTTAALQISSAANQTFILGGSATAISTITITEGSSPSITDANNIRIRIPSTFTMTFDTSDALANIGGADWAKTGAGSQGGTVTVSYEDSNKTVVVPVTSDFSAQDDITVYGLSFTSFTAVSSADNLEIEVDNGGTIADTDDKTITIVAPTLSSFINQTFTVSQSKATSSSMTITDASTAFITAANDIRIRIPSTFNMTWDATNPIVTVAPTLDDYTSSFSTNDLPVATIDVSGVTYSSTTDSLFVIINGTPTIYEYTLGGDWVRTVNMNGFIDTEGIDWMYGNTFAVTQERSPYDIITFPLDQSTTTLAKSEGTVITPNFTCTTNLCMEGISYDVANDWFYVVSEKQAAGGSGGRVFKVEMDGTATEYTTLGTALSDAGYTDLADIAYDPVSTNFFLLSEENNTIIEATTTGTIINTFAVDTGIFTQPEGLDFTPDGDSMFIVGEADDYQHLTRDSKIDNACTFEDSNKTLVLNVTSDFSAGESRTIGLMSFANFTAQSSADNLELEVMNNGSSNDEDDKTITITGGASLSVTASSTLDFTAVGYSFSAQSSTSAVGGVAGTVGGVLVGGGAGTWTLNLSCNDGSGECMWRGVEAPLGRFQQHIGIAGGVNASASGIFCIDFTNFSCGASCTGVTPSTGYKCFNSSKTDITLATGSAATGNYWLKESSWQQGVPAAVTASMYMTTIVYDLQ